MATLALCPSRGRPAWAREALETFEATIRDPKSRLVFVVDTDDATRRDYPLDHTVFVEPRGCMGEALAQAAHDKAVLRDATSVGMVGDDNRWRTPGWDLILDGHLSQNIGIAYGDDGFQHERLPTSWWVSRPLVDAFGMAPSGLRHLYMDNWWKSLGEGAGCLRYFPEVNIEHMHPIAGKAEQDDIYRRGNSPANARNDRRWFHEWERRQRLVDVKRARQIIAGSGDKRRVLADWHHPALWESLSILFEDRFGWELYSMGGEDWTKHGWNLQAGPPIGWSAAQYLSLEGAKPVNSHFEMTEREYPKRPRKMVTPEQAFGQSWDYIVGSVPDHQRSFASLAGKLGARFVHQVGNAKHPIDQSLNQVILASSNIRVSRRTPHVTYHQEFDRGVFAPGPLTDPLAVTSLMLRLDWTSCDYRWLSESGCVRWSAPGGSDPTDKTYLAPMSKVADLINASGWVWHDKRIGDGYGHVLHTAAAMGRPLIGHGSHYKGLMGEPFWQDMRTCIDLDKHDPVEALRLIRAISADPDWHGEMSERIAALFDQLVDFDSEAEQVKTLLTTG